MALHFGFSLVAVAGVFLVMRVLDEQHDQSLHLKPPAPKFLSVLLWSSVAVVYVVAYSGAYIKHAQAEDSCRTWPLCDGQLWPGFGGSDGVVFMHRLAALGSVFLIGGIAWLGYRARCQRPDLHNLTLLALLVVICQAIVGAIVVQTDMQLVSTLLHAGLMAVLFLVLCEGCRVTWPARFRVERPDSARSDVPLTSATAD